MTKFESIPSIEQLRQRPSVLALEVSYGRQAVIDALRLEADAMRARLASGESPADVALEIERAVPARLQSRHAPSLVPVINATGVVVHTNLGRAPLSRSAVDRVASLASGYSNLEYRRREGRARSS